MKYLVYDDKMFFGKNGELYSCDGDHNVTPDTIMFDPDTGKPAEADQYSSDEDLNEFREALGLEKVELDEESANDEDDDT